MPGSSKTILIVDDEEPIRTSLAQILSRLGHGVRSASDGFSALCEMRLGVPEILLSDLNMPGMSGFELLSVVRRRFPAAQVVAMSGAFPGDAVPAGVAADAFYEKGTNVGLLLEILQRLIQAERQPPTRHSGETAPIWIPRNGHDASGDAYVTLACPECLRTFAQVVDASVTVIRQADCVHCSTLIRYAVIHQPEVVGLGRLE
jgi:DNA-binding NtrC family response regulator